MYWDGEGLEGMTQTQKMIDLIHDLDELAKYNVKSVTLRHKQYKELCKHLGVRTLHSHHGMRVN